ncbi:MAG: hypothetical protein ABJK59_10180 [Erythrobacter sp.]|uniref:hypothetical protein n=1 Tax=Erythrobacter sp. TaxID=1042 RepID=UPI0032999615
MRSSILGVLFLTGIWALPMASASAQVPIEIEVGAPWTHPHSGITVPSELGGLRRGQATQFAEDFLNIGFSFPSPDGTAEISLYIYRHTNGAVPVWFRQAQTGIELRDIYAKPELTFGVEQYGWPGAEEWQGLRAIYATPNSRQIASTAVVLFSVDGWLVKMRVSSFNKGPEEMALMIDAAFAELTPPNARIAQSPAIAVEDCEEKLKFKKARDAKTDGASSILGALLGSIVPRGEQDESEEGEAATPEPASVWCRDGSLNPTQVAYRANGATDAYLLAIGDSGMGISVGPDAAGQILQTERPDSKPNYSITLITDSRRVNYAPQDRLPSLRRVMEVLNTNQAVSSMSTWGDENTINIQSGALEN